MLRPMRTLLVALVTLPLTCAITCTTKNADGECYRVETDGYQRDDVTGDGALTDELCSDPGFCPMSEVQSNTATHLRGDDACGEVGDIILAGPSAAVTDLDNVGLLGCSKQGTSGTVFFWNEDGTTSEQGSTALWPSAETRYMICVSADAKSSLVGFTTLLVSHTDTTKCTPYPPPSVPPSPPPPLAPPPEPPSTPAPFQPAVLRDAFPLWAIILIIVLTILCLCCLFWYLYYYYIILGRRKKRLPKAKKLSKFEEDAQTLFMLMDWDSSGYITIVELVKVLRWMGANMRDGQKWIRVMFLALPLEEGTEGKDQGLKDVPDPTPQELVKLVDELEFVEDGRMNLQEFTDWLRVVVKSFDDKTYDHSIEMLKEYLRKEQQAIRLFNTWDNDGSGVLETKELKAIVGHFKKYFVAADSEFVVLDEYDTKDLEAGGTNVTIDGWKNNAVASLDYMATKDSIDLVGFKGWLMSIAGVLSPETFDKAMEEMTAIVTKSVSTKLLFKIWDADDSGFLDFAEIGKVLQWFSENVPGEVDFARLFQSLDAPKDGKMSFEAFNMWFLVATKGMSAYSHTVIMEKLKEHVRSMGFDPQRENTKARLQTGYSTQQVV